MTKDKNKGSRSYATSLRDREQAALLLEEAHNNPGIFDLQDWIEDNLLQVEGLNLEHGKAVVRLLAGPLDVAFTQVHRAAYTDGSRTAKSVILSNITRGLGL